MALTVTGVGRQVDQPFILLHSLESRQTNKRLFHKYLASGTGETIFSYINMPICSFIHRYNYSLVTTGSAFIPEPLL